MFVMYGLTHDPATGGEYINVDDKTGEEVSRGQVRADVKPDDIMTPEKYKTMLEDLEKNKDYLSCVTVAFPPKATEAMKMFMREFLSSDIIRKGPYDVEKRKTTDDYVAWYIEVLKEE